MIYSTNCKPRYYHILIPKMKIATKKPISQKQANAEMISALSSHEHYFLIHTRTKEQQKLQKKTQKYDDDHLMVLTYRSDPKLTIGDLVKKFIKEAKETPYAKSVKEEIKKTCFETELGNPLEDEMTIKQLKRFLRNDDIDGIRFYPRLRNITDTMQCAAIDFLQNQANFFKKATEVPFIHKPTQYILYIHIQYTDNLEIVKLKLRHEIQRVFSKMVNLQALKIKYFYDPDWVNLEDKIIQRLKQSDKVQFDAQKTSLQTPHYENANFVIIKGEGIEPKTFQYERVRHIKVIDLLNTIQPQQEWDNYGLMVGDMTLKSNQKFQKLAFLFTKSTSHSKHIACIIIKEMHVFELEQEQIKKRGKLNIESVVFDDKTNREHEKTCQRQLQKRAQETTLDSFKHDSPGIKPILLYTSQLKVYCSKDVKNVNPLPLYLGLNQFLRSQEFCKISDADYSKWEYMFGCQLLQQLRKIPCITDQVLWRGIRHSPSYSKGQTILFKQFTSSSLSEVAAKEFAEKAIFKIIKSYSGRCIKEFSFYKYEDEILFEPYVYFKVLDIETIEKSKGIELPCFILEEIKKEQVPKNVVRFVLWIDDKTKEGKQIWKYLSQIKSTTLMVQLLSTEELQHWFYVNKAIVQDPSVEIMMISNMKRIENGIPNERAGVEAVRYFKKYRPDGHIFIYIGWIQGAIQKLTEGHLYPDKLIQVSNQPQDIVDFLRKHCVHVV